MDNQKNKGIQFFPHAYIFIWGHSIEQNFIFKGILKLPKAKKII